MEPLLVYTAPPLRLTVSSRASPAAVALLEQTRYGTHGPQYRHTGQAKKIPRLTAPFFFDLWRGEYLVGTYCLSARRVQTPAGPHLFYSYIEAGSARSLRISAAAGFAPLAQLEALSFGRLYPRADPRVRPLLPAEAFRLRDLLSTAFHHHPLVPVDLLAAGPAYVVLEEQGQIVAGVRAYATHWQITQLPGLSSRRSTCCPTCPCCAGC